MTLLTERIVQRLGSAGEIFCYNWSPRNVPMGIGFRLRRGWRHVASALKLLRGGRVQNRRLYIAVNSRAGIWLTMLLVLIGRGLGYDVYLHHHTYSYIDQLDRRMRWICSWLGDRGAHVVHCRQMEQDFRRTYPAAKRFVHLNPSMGMPAPGVARSAPGQPFRMGHLGNLAHAKGLDLVLATFEELRREGRAVQLELAGPCYTGESRRLIERALEGYGGDVRWIGPAFDQSKWDFLARIDCFLFPTRSESWGLVLNEAMGAGVPVIATDRGCIRTVVGDGAGLVIDELDDYPSRAAAQVKRWIDYPAEYQAASQSACTQAAMLQREADQMLDEFVGLLFQPHPSLRATPASSSA